MNKRGLKINEEITAKSVRLVIEDSEAAIVPVEEALNIARDKGLDLVEISPNQDPPVVKVMNYSRYVFAQRKKSKEQKKKQKITHLKGASGLNKKQKDKLTPEAKKIRIMTTRSFFEAMKLFYQKHYQKKYFFLLRWLVYLGIDFFKTLRILKIRLS